MTPVSAITQSTGSSEKEHQTRAQLLRQSARAMMDERGIKLRAFTLEIIRVYSERVPDRLATLPMRDISTKVSADDFETMLDARIANMKAYMDPDNRRHIPAEIEESWVMAMVNLSPEHGRSLQRSLVRRHGFQGIVIPTASPSDNGITGVASLTRRYSESMADIATMLEDGRIGPEDANVAAIAIRNLQDTASACYELAERIRINAVPQEEGAA